MRRVLSLEVASLRALLPYCLPSRSSPCSSAAKTGADDQDRTGDLVLTKDVLCQLSYIGLRVLRLRRSRLSRRRILERLTPVRPSSAHVCMRSEELERETGIEPATNSLEGCDSTTELLPPTSRSVPRFLAYSHPTRRGTTLLATRLCWPPTRSAASPPPRSSRKKTLEGSLPSPPLFLTDANSLRTASAWRRVGGEGRVRTSVATRAADLQSAAIDRSATSPNSVHASRMRGQPRHGCSSHRIRPRLISDSITVYCDAFPWRCGRTFSRWSWRRDLNPRPADYKSAALPD